MNHYEKKLGGLVCLLSVLSMTAIAGETYVFPAANQSAEQQKKDEYECYLWAVEQSGYDPVESNEAESGQTTADSDSTSSQSGGAGKSMLGGAVIAEVSDGDAGKGAATGATLGLMKGKRKQQAAQEQERIAAEERARAEAEARQKLVSNYERANAACLEGRDYVIK